MNLAVDVISDVICPWCYIGKRRLERAIAAVEGQHEVQVHWHPFQLNPTMPKEGISRKEYRVRKFGSWERSLELDAKVIAVGESERIHFAFDKTERTPNTVDAHRLIWLAGVDLKVIQKRLGHRDFSTTANTYSHLPQNAENETVSLVDDLMSKRAPKPSPEAGEYSR